VEHLVTLVVVRLRVRVAIDGLLVPLGLLELNLLLEIHLLFALPQVGRHAFLAQLLLLLVELLCELPDFPTLSHTVARGVVHWATRSSIITAGRLMGVFVASRTSAPDHRCSSSYGSGSSS
jgi:hypothetical protein